MFRLIIEDKNIDMELENANDVANVFFENTNDWLYTSHLRETCSKAKSGDITFFDIYNITILCL